MWDTTQSRGDADTCCDCGGRHLHGEPMHVSRTKEFRLEGTECWTEFRCRECSEDYARDWWDEESQGRPCPFPPVPQTSRRLS